MPTAVSLFTGCGGSDKGLIDAGYSVVMANDILPYAQEVYQSNLPETDFRMGSIEDIKTFPPADLLVGCYPCQGFSQGGARDTNRKVNYLYREFDRALRVIRPKAFIVENVSGMARSNNRQLLNNQLTRFRLAGYRVSCNIVRATNYGLAQDRRRIFMVGIRSNFRVRYSFPEPMHDTPGLPEARTQREALHGLDQAPLKSELYDVPFHWYYLSRNRYRSWDEPSKTILANARHMPLHPSSPRLKKVGPDVWRFEGDQENARRLSFREAAALQDLKHWHFPDTVGIMRKYQVIGNAVPPMILKQIVDAIPKEVVFG